MVKSMRRKRQSGQAIMLTVVAVGLVLIGGMGLAIDAGQLYGQRQMAQAAADAAAEAAVLSVFGGTNTTSGNTLDGTTFTCANGTDTRSPCAYARLNGFATTGSTDNVTVSFPTSVPGVTLSSDFTPAAAHALVTRQVSTTLMQLLGAPASMAIKAAGTAAITAVPEAVPILVTHPSLKNALELQGNPTIKICGGPSQSIQVNSNNLVAAHAGGSAQIDLSKGGPADTAGNCTTGTGTIMGVFGGPTTFPKLTPLGSTTRYDQPSFPILDPLKNVSPPSQPSTNCGATGSACKSGPMTPGAGGCPASPKKDCYLYTPGYYPGGLNIKNETAVFSPGVYYMDGSKGFSNDANGEMYMCSGCAADTGGTGHTMNTGMLVYMSKNAAAISVGSNSSAFLLGSSSSSDFKGILFFVDRNSPARTHSLGGGGAMTLQGTIYATNTTMTASVYQTISLGGGSGSGTLIQGEIIASVLQLSGNGSITMQLDPSATFDVNRVALVN